MVMFNEGQVLYRTGVESALIFINVWYRHGKSN